MGREIKRVALDFDWPLSKVWLGYRLGICTDEVELSMPNGKEAEADEVCDFCRHAAKLMGRQILDHGCPAWKIEPPAGDGWQLWETVSEGSPVSPVFATPEELADWLVSPGNDKSITAGTTRTQWLQMFRAGWAPSMIADQHGLRPGVQAMAD